MLHIGCHLSSTKGYATMGREALRIGADTFAFFTRNPRGGNVKPMDEEDAAELHQLLKRENFAPLVAHAPYTYNLCSDKPRNREFAKESLQEDLHRLEYIPGNYCNFHPGNHMKQGKETGISMIADALNEILWEGMQTTVLLETMSGKGTEIGRSFQELRAIIDKVRLQEQVGVCLDTCHVYDAGYDIAGCLDEVLDTFDRILGIGRLKAIHINDTKNPFASHKDRHEKIGEGCLGIEALTTVVRHPLMKDLPFILETPQEDNDGYAEEIRLLRAAAQQTSETNNHLSGS